MDQIAFVVLADEICLGVIVGVSLAAHCRRELGCRAGRMPWAKRGLYAGGEYICKEGSVGVALSRRWLHSGAWSEHTAFLIKSSLTGHQVGYQSIIKQGGLINE